MHTHVTAQPVDTPEVQRSISNQWRLWVAGTGLALIAVTAAFQVAQQAAGPLVVSGSDEVTIGTVLGMTIIGSVLGAAIASGVRRFAERPRAVFLMATFIALAGYAVVPFTASESVATAIWLNLFHVVVAVPVVAALARSLPSNRVSPEA